MATTYATEPLGKTAAFFARPNTRVAVGGGILGTSIVIMVGLPLFVAVKIELRSRIARRDDRLAWAARG